MTKRGFFVLGRDFERAGSRTGQRFERINLFNEKGLKLDFCAYADKSKLS